MEPRPKSSLMAQIPQVFTPSAPVKSRGLFAGRNDELMETVNVLNEPGRHVVLYGERGVGKTSLANVLSQFVTVGEEDDSFSDLSVGINCSTNDKFRSVWTKVARALELELPESWKYSDPDPDEIRILLGQIQPPMLIVIDEYDRFEDDHGITLMADTLKSLSDHHVESKLVLVGVADSIDQLIGEHESIQRAISEVHLARMSEEDSSAIIKSGAEKLGLPIDDDASRLIVRMSEGLPTYVHLLAQYAFQAAAANDNSPVNGTHVNEAIKKVVEKHSLRKEYQTAIQSPRRDNLFPHVLAACALAEKNPLGQFTASAVKVPLSKIRGQSVDVPSFSRHLSEFMSAERGSVLKREGTPRKYTYRFRNPLLQPFAIIAAISDGIIPDGFRDQILTELA